MNIQKKIITPLMEGALPPDVSPTLALKELSHIEAWCEIVNIPQQRGHTASMAWLTRYCAEIYTRAQSLSLSLSTYDLNNGRPSPSFEQAIDLAIRAARATDIINKTDLGEIYVLPIGTFNAMFTPADGLTRPRVYFRTGMHECVDGLLRILCSIESALSIEGFSQVNFTEDAWQYNYHELVKECLNENPKYVILGTTLLAQFFMGGHPRNTYRIPMLNSGVVLHKVLLRFVEVFRVGHEIGHAWLSSTTSEVNSCIPTRIGDVDVLVLKTDEENEIAADLIAFGVIAKAADDELVPLPKELIEYALVAPDLALSVFAVIEQCLVEMGWHRPAADPHVTAIQRRNWYRKFLENQNDLRLIKLGQRFEIVLTELRERVGKQEIYQHLRTKNALNPSWISRDD